MAIVPVANGSLPNFDHLVPPDVMGVDQRMKEALDVSDMIAVLKALDSIPAPTPAPAPTPVAQPKPSPPAPMTRIKALLASMNLELTRDPNTGRISGVKGSGA